MAALSDCVTLLSAWPELASTSGVTASNCCSVSGVSCSAGRITTLTFAGFSYSTANLGVYTGIGGLSINKGAAIPSALFDLSELSVLWIAGAGLTGPIPSGFSRLTNLYELHIESNALTGGFPDDWSSFTSLRYFHADNNQLSGDVSSALASVSALELKTLLIQNNSFTGTVPNAWANAAISDGWVDLYGNCLSSADADVNSKMCQINCNWFDLQNTACADVTAYLSQCWNANPSGCTANVIADEPGRVINVVNGVPVGVASASSSSSSNASPAVSSSAASSDVSTVAGTGGSTSGVSASGSATVTGTASPQTSAASVKAATTTSAAVTLDAGLGIMFAFATYFALVLNQ
ncbi:hypothetical protein HDU83_007888 [Entophlyctis luteolus]|nr:hypothetical protein HDU83_007888 [Entophlyctis luteolus]